MTKRNRYKIGDIIEIPLLKNSYGIGRILNKINYVALFELFYYIKKKEEIINFDLIENKNKKLILWAFDEEIRNGNWKIVANKKNNYEIIMPMYYGWADSIKGNDRSYYIQQGNFNDPLHGVGEMVTVSEEKAKNFLGEGIAFPNRLIYEFQKFLDIDNNL